MRVLVYLRNSVASLYTEIFRNTYVFILKYAVKCLYNIKQAIDFSITCFIVGTLKKSNSEQSIFYNDATKQKPKEGYELL